MRVVRSIRRGTACFVVFGAGSLALGATQGLAQRTRPAPVAHLSSRVLRSTDVAYLRYNEQNSEGSNLYEEGPASGTLPGSMHVYADVGPTLRASFMIFTRGGTIYGRGLAASHGSGNYESFAGTLTAVGGTGLYAHAHGRAGLYGVLNRRTYAMTVQTTGTLFY